ncbi:MAG: ImmA/IrrE family metallo-endopeptidase [Gammaproteobacteria bacterium]
MLTFSRYWGAPHPVIAMERAIDAAFPDLDRMQPPIDLRKLGERRGIKVVERPIDADGLIFRAEDEGYVVVLNTRAQEERRRFTLAHEIAHTFFFDAEGCRGYETTASRGEVRREVDPEEEHLCDYGAAKILMPKGLIAPLLDTFGPSAHFVVQVARTFKVSMRASARHLVKISDTKIVVGYWEYRASRGQFETSWVEGRETAKGRRAMAVGKDQPIFDDFLAAQDFRGRRWMSLGGDLQHYFVDAVFLKGTPRRWLTEIVLDPIAERGFVGRSTRIAGLSGEVPGHLR